MLRSSLRAGTTIESDGASASTSTAGTRIPPAQNEERTQPIRDPHERVDVRQEPAQIDQTAVRARLRFGAQLAAGRRDIAAHRHAHGADDAFGFEDGAEGANAFVAGRAELRIGVLLYGMMLTWCNGPRIKRASASASCGRSFTPVEHHVLEEYFAIRLRDIALARRINSWTGHLRLTGMIDERTSSVRRVQRNRQIHLHALGGERIDLRNDADGRNRNMAMSEVEALRVVEQAHCIHHRVVIVERLAHAHEHDVGDPAALLREMVREVSRLIEDLGRGEMTGEAGPARSNKKRTHTHSRTGWRYRRCCARCNAASAPLRLRCRRASGTVP